jgi:hypothetical protein
MKVHQRFPITHEWWRVLLAPFLWKISANTDSILSEIYQAKTENILISACLKFSVDSKDLNQNL